MLTSKLINNAPPGIKKHTEHPFAQEIFKIISIIISGLLVAVGLEGFLIPNGFLDGGVTGISIILANFINIPIGVFIGLLNIPFIIIAWIKIGKISAIRTVIGIATLSITTIILHHMDPFTNEYVLALGYGGLLLGLGVGTALRYGGALDGLESLASVVSNNSKFSVDQIILYVNIAIFITAAIFMDAEKAMGSALLFYVVVSPIISKIVDGGHEMKQVRVSTHYPELIAELVSSHIHRKVTSYQKTIFTPGKGFHDEIYEIVFTISRLEESMITDEIIETDPDAIISFVDISTLRGGIHEKENNH